MIIVLTLSTPAGADSCLLGGLGDEFLLPLSTSSVCKIIANQTAYNIDTCMTYQQFLMPSL